MKGINEEFFTVMLLRLLSVKCLFFKFIYFERERERIPSRLCTVSTEADAELDPMNHGNMT